MGRGEGCHDGAPRREVNVQMRATRIASQAVDDKGLADA